ncbi:MAG TPA: FxLYD domain-containing protein [Blastocatellia bacterium]|nr:FxLYD domain-containing protein [Blastocatellia bacterium]
MESTTKICQQCKEEIKAAAKKCRYCHSMQGGFRATLSNPAYTPFVGVAVALPVMLVAFYFMRSSLDRNEKEFEKYRSLVVVQDSKIHYAKEGDSNFVSTIGTIKNNSDKKWKELRIEVQYFNQSGALIDTQSDSDYSLVLLPKTEHAFRVREAADKPEAEYVSHKVFIRDARDADSWP